MNRLESYFRRCLEAEYEEGENAVSWSIQKEGKVMYILFQHSHGVTDWKNNLTFHAEPYQEMDPKWECHAGFLKVWRSVKGKIGEAVISAMKEGIEEIKVIGYSHGAALAVLCHEWIWYRAPVYREKMQGFGFGCPRVIYGCVPPELAIRWEKFYVIRNGEDLVTHLPPRFFGYCHVGNLICLEGEKRLSGINAHRPENYLSALQKLGEHDGFFD